MKHTPGPWKLGKRFGLLPELNLQSVFAADETEWRGPTSICTTGVENAALIAAAPEMLEALESLMPAITLAIETQSDSRVGLEYLKNLIKRARGES